MKPEDHILFLCTRQTFTDDHKELVINHCQENTIDWKYIFQLAMKDGVISLVGQNLFQIHPDILNIPPSYLTDFRKIQMRNIAIKKLMEIRMTEILSYFDQKDIDVMLIKGEALNFMVYKEPWFTISTDIDLILRPRYKKVFSDNEIHGIGHFLHKYNKLNTIMKQHIEFDIYEHHDVTMNRILPIDFDQIWDDAKKIPAYGNEIHIMTPEDTLIAIAINSCRKRFFRLKSLCDIAEVVQTFPELNWTDLIRKAKLYHCNNILFTAFYVTQSTIGCSLPGKLLTDLGINPVKNSIIRGLVKVLLQYSSLDALSFHSIKNKTRSNPSLSLLVTYATYSWGQIIRKITQIILE